MTQATISTSANGSAVSANRQASRAPLNAMLVSRMQQQHGGRADDQAAADARRWKTAEESIVSRPPADFKSNNAFLKFLSSASVAVANRVDAEDRRDLIQGQATADLSE